MILTIEQIQTIYEIYPSVVTMTGDIAYDINKNQVSYDIDVVNAKVLENEQAQASAKASALAKLTALGLTQDELTALLR